jgi:hypothetical protein
MAGLIPGLFDPGTAMTNELYFRHCERSEAIQTFDPLDCFVRVMLCEQSTTPPRNDDSNGIITMSTPTITLGGRRFAVEAFTFDQLQRILPAFARLKNGLAEGGLEAARDIIAAALAGQIGADELAQLRTSVGEILAAIPVIAEVSGLTSVGETLAGAARDAR